MTASKYRPSIEQIREASEFLRGRGINPLDAMGMTDRGEEHVRYARERLDSEPIEAQRDADAPTGPAVTPEERIARIVAFAEGLGRKAEVNDMTHGLIRDAATWVRAYTGSFDFLTDLRAKGCKSAGQAKGVVNCVRADLARGGDGQPAQAPQTPAATTTPGHAREGQPNRYSGSCGDCGGHVHADAGITVKNVLTGKWGVFHGAEPGMACPAKSEREADKGYDRSTDTPAGIDLRGLPLGIKSGSTERVGRFAYQPEDGQAQFIVVEAPTEGDWVGTIFVKRQHSSELTRAGLQRPGGVYGGGNAAPALLAILADPEAAMLLYGRLIQKCGHCGRPLTNLDSRERGIGPVCASKMGW